MTTTAPATAPATPLAIGPSTRALHEEITSAWAWARENVPTGPITIAVGWRVLDVRGEAWVRRELGLPEAAARVTILASLFARASLR